mmetsp:Transcript_68226/g.113416  ORF Transcript_68226/g.113416 Transcript_68226/m.113416 type:complete len:150 (-) Transcript_68226:209-658(-)
MQAAQMEHKGWLVAAESQQRLLLQPDEAMEVGRVFAGAMLRRNAPREVCDAIATISRRHLEVQFCPRSGCAAIVVCSDNGIRLERFRASTVELGNGKGGEMRHGDALWLCTRDGVGDSFKLMLMVEPTPGLAVADPPSKGISVGLTLSV